MLLSDQLSKLYMGHKAQCTCKLSLLGLPPHLLLGLRRREAGGLIGGLDAAPTCWGQERAGRREFQLVAACGLLFAVWWLADSGKAGCNGAARSVLQAAVVLLYRQG